MLRSAVGMTHVLRSVLVMGLWNKARGLGQGWTRPAGRAPGRPSPRAAGPRLFVFRSAPSMFPNRLSTFWVLFPGVPSH